MHSDVVSPAQEHEVREIRGAAVFPFDEVVHVAPLCGRPAPRVLTVLITDQHGPALGSARGA